MSCPIPHIEENRKNFCANWEGKVCCIVCGQEWANKKSDRPDWPEYAMMLAEVAARRSQDNFEKVGACVLRHDNSVGGIGFNNPPPGIDLEFMDDRDRRRPFMSHAELSALRYLRPGEGKLIACTLRPCCPCLTQIAMYGINLVYYKKEYEREPLAEELAKKFKIELIKI